MAAHKLKSVRLLANHGARIVHTNTTGERTRFERPGGALSTHEAALLLHTYPEMIVRMARAGRLKLLPRGRRRVPLSELRRLLAMPTYCRVTAEWQPDYDNAKARAECHA